MVQAEEGFPQSRAGYTGELLIGVLSLAGTGRLSGFNNYIDQ